MACASENIVEACVARLGLITNGELLKGAFAKVMMKWTGMADNVSVEEIKATMLEDVVEAFKGDTVGMRN